VAVSCLVLTFLLVGGCSGESYDDVLRGLRSAAMSKATYNALRHAEDLDATDKAVVNAFCSVATQLANNGESLSEQQFFDRVKARTQIKLGQFDVNPVNAAVGKLRATYDLAQINGGAARLYVQACFR